MSIRIIASAVLGFVLVAILMWILAWSTAPGPVQPTYPLPTEIIPLAREVPREVRREKPPRPQLAPLPEAPAPREEAVER